MALVYRSWDTRLRRWCAIKVLRPEFNKRKSIRDRFEREAQAMALLDHRHIVRVFDVGADTENTWIIMELCGTSLDDWLGRHGRMPARLAVNCLLQVASAIEAAHAQGIVHRDIKPQNVLVTEQGVCKVGDFGIAQLEAAHLTRTGTTMGTLGFMAPEQRDDAKAVDERSDIYSLGATLYTLLTERVSMDLHAADRDPAMLAAVPHALRDVVQRATAYHPSLRYQTVHDLRQALKQASALLPPLPPGTPPLVEQTVGALTGSAPTAGESFEELPLAGQTLLPPTNATPVPRPQPAVRAPTPDPAWERAHDDTTVLNPKARPSVDPKVLPYVPWNERGRRDEPVALDQLYVPTPVEPDRDLPPEDMKYVSQTVPFDPTVRTSVDGEPLPALDGPEQVGGGMGAGWAAKQLLEFAGQIGLGLLKASKYIVWPVALFAAVVVYSGNQTTRALQAHQSEVEVRVSALEKAIERDPTLPDELVAMGASGAVIAQYDSFAKASDPEVKRKEALRLAKLLEEQASRLDESDDPDAARKAKALRKRVDVITRARRGYAEAVQDFEKAAAGMGSGLAVQLGIAPQPPED